MGVIFDALVKFFEEDDWKYTPHPDEDFIHLGFSGENGKLDCFARAKEKAGICIFYSLCPVKVPERLRPAMAEYITRANYGLMYGNFEMDYSDGEVRFKTSIDVQDDRLTSGLIKPLIYANIALMDKYLPGIMAVVYGNASPKEAIEEIEGKS